MEALSVHKRLMNGEPFVVFDILQYLRQRGKLTPLESSIGKIICRHDWFCVYIFEFAGMSALYDLQVWIGLIAHFKRFLASANMNIKRMG